MFIFETERAGEEQSLPSRPRNASAEPNAGLELTTRAKVKSWTLSQENEPRRPAHVFKRRAAFSEILTEGEFNLFWDMLWISPIKGVGERFLSTTAFKAEPKKAIHTVFKNISSKSKA